MMEREQPELSEQEEKMNFTKNAKKKDSSFNLTFNRSLNCLQEDYN